MTKGWKDEGISADSTIAIYTADSGETNLWVGTLWDNRDEALQEIAAGIREVAIAFR